MSAGLTARKYWCSMLKLGASYQQLLAKVGHLGALSPHELSARKGPDLDCAGPWRFSETLVTGTVATP